MYRIREIDGQDDEVAGTLADLHRLTFFDGASVPDFDRGHWWLAFHETAPIGFAGVIPATRAFNAGYCGRSEEALWQYPSAAIHARRGSSRAP
jgi:hypothetical protein